MGDFFSAHISKFWAKPPKFRRTTVVVITGASSGIGRELAIQYSRRQCRLVLAARSESNLKEVCDICRSNGSKAVAVVTDVSKEADCRNLIKRTIECFEQLDLLILSAGRGCHNVFSETEDLSVFEDLLRVNLMGSVYCSRFALPHLKDVGGQIVAISSMSGELGLPYRTAYCASKFAVNGFFESLRTELSVEGTRNPEHKPVNICLICPSTVRTRLRENAIKPHSRVNTPHTGKAIDVKECATVIIDAADRRLRKVCFPLSSYAAVCLKPLFPTFIDSQACKHVSAL
eukprot:196826_1